MHAPPPTYTTMARMTLAVLPIPMLDAVAASASSLAPGTILAHGLLFGGLLGGAVWLAWFIIGIILAIWTYRDAGSRGTSGLLWAIIVIILPILGIIIYLVIRPSPTASPHGYEGPPGSAPPPQIPSPHPPAQPPQAPPGK